MQGRFYGNTEACICEAQQERKSIMLIAFFDFETTGVDVNQDRVTEVGALLYTTGYQRVVMAEQFLVEVDRPIVPKVTELTKIRKPLCDKFGLVANDALPFTELFRYGRSCRRKQHRGVRSPTVSQLVHTR